MRRAASLLAAVDGSAPVAAAGILTGAPVCLCVYICVSALHFSVYIHACQRCISADIQGSIADMQGFSTDIHGSFADVHSSFAYVQAFAAKIPQMFVGGGIFLKHKMCLHL